MGLYSVFCIAPALLIILTNSVLGNPQNPATGALGYGNNWPPTSGLKKRFNVESDVQLNWYGAFMYCLRKGQRLAAIHSQEENDAVLEAIVNTGIQNGQFWTSGTDFYLKRWQWMSSGRVAGYTNWHEGEPNNDGTGACIQIEGRDNRNKGTKWNDDRCTTHYNFICEYY